MADEQLSLSLGSQSCGFLFSYFQMMMVVGVGRKKSVCSAVKCSAAANVTDDDHVSFIFEMMGLWAHC